MDYHHGNLKDTLIHLGIEELKNTGIEDLSLRQIAERAGVSHNAPYRHFKNKSELVDQMFYKVLSEWAEQIEKAPSFYPASLVLQIQYVGRIFTHAAIRYPQQTQILFSGLGIKHSPSNYLRAGQDLIRKNMEALLNEERGYQLQKSAPIEFLVAHLMAVFRGFCLMFLTQSGGELLPTSEALVEITDQAVENILLPHMT